MYSLLSQTGLYNLKSNRYIKAEIESYLSAIKIVNDELENLLKYTFVQISDDEHLEKFERQLELVTDNSISIEERRKIIIHRLGISQNHNTRQGLEQSIYSTGLEVSVIEDIPGGRCIIECNRIVGSEDNFSYITQQVDKITPAHLNADIDIGIMTWYMFQSKQLTFNMWNDADFTWTFFDIKGQYI